MKSFIEKYQRNFPLVSRPFESISLQEDLNESEVIEFFKCALMEGQIVRVGSVIRAHQIGVSTLCAMKVPKEKLEEVAYFISSLEEVNHNYERDNDFNLWFVLISSSEEGLLELISKIENKTGLKVLDLRLEEEYFIDLGFKINE